MGAAQRLVDQVKQVYVIWCHSCEVGEEVDAGSAERAAVAFERLGWTVEHGGIVLCDGCK